MTETAPRPITDTQADLIQRLMDERELETNVREATEKLLAAGTLTTRQASGVIDTLQAHPQKAREDAPAEEGFYFHDGQVYRVQRSRSSDRLYAKRLQVDEDTGEGQFVYAPGAMRHLTADDRLTRVQAAEFGYHHGICAMCGAHLTDPDSVERGYGPICARKLG